MSNTQDGVTSEGALSLPTAWVVRAGRTGETVRHNLESGVVTIEWDDWVAPELARFESRDAYGDYIHEQFRGLTQGQRRSARDQIWRFYHEVQIGDLVVMPLKNYGSADDWIAIGRVRGAAERDISRPVLAQHRRAVQWLSDGVSKIGVQSDLRSSIDSNGTVFGVRVPQGASRILYLAEHGEDPGSDRATSEESGTREADGGDGGRASVPAPMFVMTWNPEKWIIKSEEYERRVIETSRGVTVRERWSTGGRKSGIAAGDEVVLFRHGTESGIVAGGRATSTIGLAEDGRYRVAVAWDVWLAIEDRLPVKVLREAATRFRNQFRASGEQLKPDQADRVREVWADWLGQPLALSGDEAGLLSEQIQEIPEGAATRAEVNRYERSRPARNQCIEHYGYACQVCGLRFEERYGEIGKDFIHVHHTTPLAQVAGNPDYAVNPVEDLVPVCPNCHAMLHRFKGRTLTVGELRERIRQAPEAILGAELPS